VAAILETMSATSSDALIFLDVAQLTTRAEGVLASDEHILSVRVYDASGRILTAPDAPEQERLLTTNPLGVRLAESDGIMYEWSADRLTSGQPVQVGNQTIGAISLEYSTRVLEENLADLRRSGLEAAVAASMLGVALALGVSRSLTRPIQSLVETTQQIAAGRLDRAIDRHTGGDEIAALGNAMEDMRARLYDLYTNLEQKVAERTRELVIARDQAQEASRLKDEFLSIMSHELRTPLNAILGYQGILELMGGLEGENLRMVQRAQVNARRLLDLINDILDISRIEAGRMDIVPTKLQVADLMNRIKSQMEVLAAEKKLGFSVVVESSMPPTIYADEDALTKILVNLLGNAFKFTEVGEVAVRLDAREGRMILSVKDTGAGIPVHMQDIIFERFRQIDSSSTRKHTGSGLGLSIVQHLCKLMGGTVRVDSEVGQGSTFTVTLPLQPLPLPQEEPDGRPVL
jgi:signal transduction histidine kinase